MQNKIFYIALIIILLSVFFVLFRPVKNTKPETTTKTETTYSPGTMQKLYKQGKDSIITKTKSLHEKIILHPSAEDSTYKYSIAPSSTWFYQGGDSSYKLSLNIQPAADGNPALDYFLGITTKDLVRIDTILITRIDTIKIKQVFTERIYPPFYNTFLFGSAVTALVIILILHFIP